MAASDSGITRHSSSREVSCITVKAGMPCFFATSRRHMRRYSRNSLLPSNAIDGDAVRASRVRPAAGDALFRSAGREAVSLFASQSGADAHTSQAPHESHLGV